MQKGKDTDCFDPFQVFKVEHQPCMLFKITIREGKNISKGYLGDLLDTPDPYVILRMRSAPNGKCISKKFDNEVNPVWNEKFTFCLNYKCRNILEITLVDANYTVDEVIGTAYMNINELTMGKTTIRSFYFNETSEVVLEMKIEHDTEPTLRYSLCLCDEEKQFLHRRKTQIMFTLQELFGDEGAMHLNHVPTIGILGSGGGFRAMVGMAGVFKALTDSGILDCATYIGCLSGSSWFLSQLYSHPKWPNISSSELLEDLKHNIDSSLLWKLEPQSLFRYLGRILKKRAEGQPVSFTDFFGHLVGEILLKRPERLGSKLTDQREKLRDRKVPLPLYTCVHVKKDVSARTFQEWVEFSPYEIGIPKYGIFLKSELFGSKFFLGRLVKDYEEQPLHYLQGIWGSAFSIMFQRLFEDNRRLDPVEMVRLEMAKEIDARHEEHSSDESDSEPAEDIPEPPKKKVCRRGKQNRQKSDHTRKSTRQEGFWTNMFESLTNSSFLTTRAGRAGVILNPLRGLSLHRTYPFSPFTPDLSTHSAASSGEFSHIFDMHPTDVKKLYVVDAGLTFNSPYPLLLRPQRGVDILLSFDFSARPSDSAQPFKELLLAEKWARINGVAFPPIDETRFEREGMKELYIFKHPTDPHCPIILHFVLVNLNFRNFKKPGVKRETREEKEFADFVLFDDPNTPYSTFNFKYSHLAFDRLSKLTEFNTLLHVDEIKQTIKECIRKKKQLGQRIPVKKYQIKQLPITTPEEKKQLKDYIKNMNHTYSTNYSSSSSEDSDDSQGKTSVMTPKTHLAFRRRESKSNAVRPNFLPFSNLSRIGDTSVITDDED